MKTLPPSIILRQDYLDRPGGGVFFCCFSPPSINRKRGHDESRNRLSRRTA